MNYYSQNTSNKQEYPGKLNKNRKWGKKYRKNLNLFLWKYYYLFFFAPLDEFVQNWYLNEVAGEEADDKTNKDGKILMGMEELRKNALDVINLKINNTKSKNTSRKVNILPSSSACWRLCLLNYFFLILI